MCSLLAATQRGWMLSAAWSPPSGPPSSQRGFKGLIYTPGLTGKVRSQKQADKQTNQTKLCMLLLLSLIAKKSDQVTGGWRSCIVLSALTQRGGGSCKASPCLDPARSRAQDHRLPVGKAPHGSCFPVSSLPCLNPCHRFLPW